MTLFFLVVGLEVTREVTVGELRDRRTVRVPVLAALGGMILPALIFLAVNAGGDGVRGWGVAMATDIAFVLGALALLGPRCPDQLRLFLLTVAIVDDIGAILVIAVFYSDDVSLPALLASAVLVGALVGVALDSGVAESCLHSGGVGVVVSRVGVRRARHDCGRADRIAGIHASALGIGGGRSLCSGAGRGHDPRAGTAGRAGGQRDYFAE